MTDFNNSSSIVCEIFISTNYDGIASAICATLCLFGVVYAFFGYRCFKAVMFLSGVIFGGTTVFLICRDERIFQQTVTMELTAGISVGIGVLCGLITLLVRYVGLFLQGIFLGVLLAFAGILALQSVYHPSTPWIPVGIIFGTAVIFAVLTLKFQKSFIIISTSVFGSVLITLCIDYFLEDFLLFRYAWEALMASNLVTACWYTWVILSVWPALSLSGVLLQWKVTAKGYDHTDVIIVRGRRKQVRTHLVRQNRSQPRTSGAGNAQRNNQRRSQTNNTRRQAVPRERSAARVVPVVPLHTDVDVPVIQHADNLPPSYFECMELGVGEPVREHDKIVHTSAGAFVSPSQSNPSRAPLTLQNDLVVGLDSGAGYLLPNSRQPTHADSAAQSRGNEAQRRKRLNLVPNHENIDRFSNSNPGQTNRGVTNHTVNQPRHVSRGAKKFKVSPLLHNSSRPGQAGSNASDTQLLLSQASKARNNREAVEAHAQRLLAAQNRRTSQQSSSSTANSQPSTSAVCRGTANHS